MTKEAFKQYVNEAIDAMDETELQSLFPTNQQPDLYTLATEFTGLKGEIKKLTHSSLKANNDFQTAMDLNNHRWEDLQELLQEKEAEPKAIAIDKDLSKILFQLIDQNDLLSDTHQHFQELGTPSWTRIQAFNKQLAAWQKGFDITILRWHKFMKSTGLHKSGLVGQIFDPRIHEAVAVKHFSDKPNNQILETEMVGYLFRNQLIRQAKVVVNKTNKEDTVAVLAKPSKTSKSKKRRKKKRRRR